MTEKQILKAINYFNKRFMYLYDCLMQDRITLKQYKIVVKHHKEEVQKIKDTYPEYFI